MSVSVNPPKTPVTKGSQGVAAATLPNVCKMPGPPAPFVPTPLPNIGRSGDSPKGYTKNVKVGGQPVAIRGSSFKSKGDAASKGTGGGLVSANTHGPTKFAGPGSRNVKFEGKNVQLLGDPMLNNCNPAGQMPNSATMVGVVQKAGLIVLAGDEVCALCGKEHGDNWRLQETADTQADMEIFAEAAKHAAETIAVMHAWSEDIKWRAAVARAHAAHDARRRKLQAQLNGALGAGHHAVADTLKRKLESLQPKLPKRSFQEAGLATMLGILRCKDGKVYASNSSSQRKELIDEMPKPWHTAASPSPYDGDDRLAVFLEHVVDKDKFISVWEHLNDKSDATRRAKSEKSSNRTQPPYYPPGQCAAPKALALALAHGGRPVGLTERYYKSPDPNATVEVLYRDALDAPPKLGEFGGKSAVPPCETCEVLLTMLMCSLEPECQHRTPKSGVCRCT